MKILIVEDDAAINQMICDYLRKRSYLCKSAYSGSEAEPVSYTHLDVYKRQS